VSEAGGLGMLTCLHCRTPEKLALEIERCRTLTSKPFGVNLTILGEKRGEAEYPEEFIAVICNAGVHIVETCGGSIPLMSKLHAALRKGGVKTIISKCVQVQHALIAQNKLGSDVISLMGFDSGGLPGEVDVGVFVQMALAKKCLKIPFVCSGGVATGRQVSEYRICLYGVCACIF
jgi:nitronate monooxygenase